MGEGHLKRGNSKSKGLEESQIRWAYMGGGWFGPGGCGLQTKEGLICPIRGLDSYGRPTGGFIPGNDLARATF